MTNLILPPGILVPEGTEIPTIQPADAPAPDTSDEDKQRVLPKPSGWKILCAVPDVSDKFEGTGIVKADTFMKQEEHATTVLFVVAMGPDAYKDKAKFSEPWCKEGDFVLVRTYSGTRFKIFGKEFRLINDDQVEAVVDDPRGVTRA